MQGLQLEENGVVYRCLWGMPSGSCGSDPVTFTGALGMTMEIFPGAVQYYGERGNMVEGN